jgi:hypothetical protein
LAVARALVALVAREDVVALAVDDPEAVDLEAEALEDLAGSNR